MNYLYDLWDDFISLLFPRICYGCGNHLLRNENLICTECYVLIPRTNYHNQKENPVEQLFWGRCQIQGAAAFSYYNKGSRIRSIIHNLKYKGIKEIGFEIGRIYGLTLKSSEFIGNVDLIIPVPLHPAKRRARGFNQSELIADGLGSITGLQVNTSAVERSVASSTQTKRSRYERWVNVEGIFRVTDPDSIKTKHILLVDDVITTGATIESCVNELLKVEGVKVSVAAIAFAPA
jgi:ComF family protein